MKSLQVAQAIERRIGLLLCTKDTAKDYTFGPDWAITELRDVARDLGIKLNEQRIEDCRTYWHSLPPYEPKSVDNP